MEEVIHYVYDSEGDGGIIARVTINKNQIKLAVPVDDKFVNLFIANWDSWALGILYSNSFDSRPILPPGVHKTIYADGRVEYARDTE